MTKQTKFEAAKKTIRRRKSLTAIVERFLIDLLENGDLQCSKPKVMWAVLNKKGEIISLKPLRRLARWSATKGETVRRVKIMMED